MTDAELIPKLIIRDRCGCNELYNRYKEKIFYLCLKILQNREDAEETMNEIFFKAIESMHTFQGDSDLLSWIKSIAHNECLNKIEKKKAERRIPIEKTIYIGDWFDYIAEAITDNEPLLAKELMEELIMIINPSLSRQRKAYYLSRIEGFNNAEIAEIMGTTKSAVESLISRAKDIVEDKILYILEKYH